MNYDPRLHTIHLQEMGYLLSLIGRVSGSTCKPWIPVVPDGRWTFLTLDARMIRKYCDLLGCTRSQLLGLYK